MTVAPRSERYTVIIVDDRAASIRKIQVHARWLTRSAAVAAAAALVGTAMFAHYALLLRARSNGRALQDENAALRSQMHLVSDRIEHITAVLDRVQRYDASLRRTMNQLRMPQRGVGGPVESRRPDPADARPTAAGADDTALPSQLALLDAAASRQESSLNQLQHYFEARPSLLASTPSVWPTRGSVTSGFGARIDPFTAERVMHSGLDIATPEGQAVYAPSDATVSYAGYENGYGKVVVLDHGYGVKTRYGHLSMVFVKPGQRVRRGARIAAVGNSGRSTGPHLHYEVRVNGIAENPRQFILE